MHDGFLEQDRRAPHPPGASWTAAKSGPAMLACYDSYLIDAHSRVTLAAEATPARLRQETLAARRMLERVKKSGPRAGCLGVDKAYGSGEFVAWLLARGKTGQIAGGAEGNRTRDRRRMIDTQPEI